MRFIVRFSALILLGLALSLGVIGLYNMTKFKEPLFFQAKFIPNDLKEKILQEKDADKAFAMTIDRKPINIFQLYLKPLVGISALYIILIAVFGLFFSHKMAGPVYRIKRTLDDAQQGKIDIKTLQFRLRKKDELQDLAESLNKFLQKYDKK